MHLCGAPTHTRVVHCKEHAKKTYKETAIGQANEGPHDNPPPHTHLLLAMHVVHAHHKQQQQVCNARHHAPHEKHLHATHTVASTNAVQLHFPTIANLSCHVIAVMLSP
jgi:hypothetical protein